MPESKRFFGNWLREYQKFTQHSESPDLFHYWTGVSTIAGALRRRVWIDEKHFQWTPNFYVVLVAPAGVVAKSTTLHVGLSLLRKVPGIHFGPKSTTWQALTESLADSEEMVQIGPDYHPMSCITCSISELGTLLRPDDDELVNVLIDLWDGQKGTWDRKTKTQGTTTINNPWINIIGATTPAWIRAHIPEVSIGGGLMSRIVFIYGDTKRHFTPYLSDSIQDASHKELEKKLIHDLTLISSMRGEYILSPAAKEWGREWYKKHWTSRPDHMASERYGGYIARKQTHIHKLAMVIAAAKRQVTQITLSDLKSAEAVVTKLETHMGIVFQSIGKGDTSRQINEILAYIKVYGHMTKQELWRLCLPIMDYKAFNECIEAATAAKFIKVQNLKGSIEYTLVKQTKEKEKK